MTREGHDLLERALKLSPAERMKLANEILDSVGDEAGDDDAELSPEWREEIERRLQDEPKPGEPWPSGEEVVARLRRELGESGGS
jgi:putative addiction module component (TIGR02574 family)